MTLKQKKEIAIGMIAYHPSQNFILRLQEIINAGYQIYIYDNTPEQGIIRDFVKGNAKNSDSLVYLTCGKNVGLGFGLSTICAQAFYDTFSALLFFDQDTVISTETLLYISNFYSGNVKLEQAYSAIVFNAKNYSNTQTTMGQIKDVRLAINSGSLYFLRNLKKMKWHSIKYFVDCVDYEFCLSSSNFGFKIGEVTTTPGFDHSTEQGDERYKLFGTILPMRPYPFSRIADSISASVKLLGKSIKTGNFVYFHEISQAILKYLFIQIYVRIARVFKFHKQ